MDPSMHGAAQSMDRANPSIARNIIMKRGPGKESKKNLGFQQVLLFNYIIFYDRSRDRVSCHEKIESGLTTDYS